MVAAANPGSTQKQVNIGITKAERGPGGGANVLAVQKFGSFAKAGGAVGDEIIGLNGRPITEWEPFEAELNQIGVGNTVTLNMVRAGKRVDMQMMLFEKKVLSLNVKSLDEVLERKISPTTVG